MQTYVRFSLTHQAKFFFTFSMCFAFSLFFVSASYAQDYQKILDKEVKLKFNGKTIKQSNGIQIANFDQKDANELLIRPKSKIFEAGEKVELQIILARGSRPVNVKDWIRFSDNAKIDITTLLLNAKPGDRLVLSFNDEQILTIPISS